MQRSAFIIFLLISLASDAQQNKIKKITWHNTGLQSVVTSSKNLHSIAFKKTDNSKLEIRPDSSFLPLKRIIYDGWYSTVYAGHIYLFEKQFGKFPANVLLKKLDSLGRKDCDFNWHEGTIYADRIEIKVTSSCPVKDDDKVFYKIENNPGFFGGSAAFQQFVQSRLSCTDYRSFIHADSALFFHAVIKRDSIAHDIVFMDSLYSPLREIIKKALINTYGWKPYYKDGTILNAWLQVFIYIKKDGSIEADYIH